MGKRKQEIVATLELTERDALALLTSVKHSLRLMRGGVGWNGDKKALQAIETELHKVLVWRGNR